MAFRLKSGKTRAFRNGKPSGFGVREIFESLLDFVYPPTCLLCETRLEEEAHLCAACWETLADSLNPRVQKGREDFRHFTGTIFFDAVVTCWEYTPSVETIIHRLKYERGRKLGLCIARAAGEALKAHFDGWGDDLLVPIPLHKIRKRERGFNQSAILCRGLTDFLSFPVCPDALVRQRNTPSQTALNAEERQENVRDAFRVRRPEVVAGRQIALVDDVVTTGATMNGCAEVLREAGAERVVGVALVRPVLE